MIYLIGGPPRCGKSTVAGLLSSAKKIPRSSVDDIVSAIRPYISEAEYKTKLPLYKVWQSNNGNNDTIYDSFNSEEIVNFYRIQAESYWPGIKAFIKEIAEEYVDYILDGCQLWPHLVNGLESQITHPIKFIVLYKSDQEAIIDGIKKNTDLNDWAIRHTQNDETLQKIAQMISYFSLQMKAEADKFGYESLNMEQDFGGQINASIRLLNSF